MDISMFEKIVAIGCSHGLTRIKFGEVEVEFGQKVVVPESPLRENVDKEALAQVEDNIKQQQIAEMILEDPLAYERLAMKELGDVAGVQVDEEI
jgi:hypothetical protein